MDNAISYMSKYIRIIVHICALSPLFTLFWDLRSDNLSVNPIQDITFRTGKPALILLVLVLSITPLRKWFGLHSLIQFRKMLGLYAFTYASLHFLVFVGLDYGFDIELIRSSVFKKPYVVLGFLAYLTLVPLAITSTRGWIRRLGKYWKLLHRLVYLTGILAIAHYIWAVKSDIRQPLLFAVVTCVLLLARIPVFNRTVHSLRERLTFK
jgi:sulfoxide reductase heme-binding subunit YedZ